MGFRSFILALLLGSGLFSVAQTITLDHFVVFCGKSASVNSLGHAFIITGKGNPFTCNIDGGDGEAYGLYAADANGGSNCKPSAINAGKSFLVGKMPGCLFNDINTEVSNYLIIRCTKAEFDLVQQVINEWKQKKYELKKQDCLSFLIAVGNIFSNRLKIPSRDGFDNFPNRFVLKLKQLNP